MMLRTTDQTRILVACPPPRMVGRLGRDPDRKEQIGHTVTVGT
jgi:hypothetical protein